MLDIDNRVDKFGSLDIAKLFFAICICAGHCGLMQGDGLIKRFCSPGLSFFFITSGFFLSYKMVGYYGSEENLQRIRNSLKNMIRRYIVWTIIALPIIICNFAESNVGFIDALLWFARDVFFRGEFALGYMSTWYVLSSIYALLMVYLTLKYFKSEKSLIVVIILFALLRSYVYMIDADERTLSQALSEGTLIKYIYDNSVGLYNGRLLFGVYAIPAGILIAKIRYPSKFSILPWLLFIICILKDKPIFVPATIWSVVLGMVSFLCCYTIRIDSGYLCRAFRRISTIVFFTHFFFIYIYLKINGLTRDEILNTNNYSSRVFFFALLCSVFCGIIIHVLCEKRKCQRITKLLL